jgi:4-aminobutyrate aminotransferase
MDVGSGVALMTTAGNATCCAAGFAVLEEIERQGLVTRAAESGHYLHRRLRETLLKHEIVGDVRGLGMIQGVELVTDRATKHPNQPAAAKVVYRAWELGLILYYAGNWGNVLEITPPLILTRDQIDEGVALLDQAIADTLAGNVDETAVAAFAGW